MGKTKPSRLDIAIANMFNSYAEWVNWFASIQTEGIWVMAFVLGALFVLVFLALVAALLM